MLNETYSKTRIHIMIKSTGRKIKYLINKYSSSVVCFPGVGIIGVKFIEKKISKILNDEFIIISPVKATWSFMLTNYNFTQKFFLEILLK